MACPVKFTKTAQYHDVTNNRRYLNVSMLFPMKCNKAAQYHDATNDRHHLNFSWYFPYNSPKQPSTMMLQIARIVYFSHDIFHGFHKQTVRYQDATNNNRYPIFSRYFPWKPPKRLGTMMLQITDIIFIFHVIFHEIHQNGSVPRCYK